MRLTNKMRWLRAILVAILALSLHLVATSTLSALPAPAHPLQHLTAPSVVVPVQLAPGNNDGGRICQTLRNCRYTPGGSFRGCVSSYSCRTCRYVVAKCTVGSSSAQCRRQVCDWGG